MAVYVDTSRNKFGRMIMCHMVADTPQELHAMADAIGMRRAWFQNTGPKRTPHYDVCLARRAKAIGLGAIVVDRRGFVDIIRRNRTSEAWKEEMLCEPQPSALEAEGGTEDE